MRSNVILRTSKVPGTDLERVQHGQFDVMPFSRKPDLHRFSRAGEKPDSSAEKPTNPLPAEIGPAIRKLSRLERTSLRRKQPVHFALDLCLAEKPGIGGSVRRPRCSLLGSSHAYAVELISRISGLPQHRRPDL
jgi:hypothetical protein